MACKANPQHLKLINRLKRIDKYKDLSINISVSTWSHVTGTKDTTIRLMSVTKDLNPKAILLFTGTSISELERFINSEREKAGLFKPRDTRLKGEKDWMKEESKYMRKGGSNEKTSL